MNDKDQIKELFSTKLANYKADVNPALWNSIASQIGGKTILGFGSLFFTKLIIGLSSALIVGLSAVVFLPNNQVAIIESKVTTSEKLQKKELEAPLSLDLEKAKDISLNKETENEPTKESEALVLTLPTEQIEADTVKTDPLYKNTRIIEQKENTTTEEKTPQQELPSNDVIKEEPFAIIKSDIDIPTYKIIKMPDVFSPNGDNTNDLFFIETEGLLDFNIVIINSSSSVVFQSTDVNFKWDGYDRFGEEAPNGRYVYFITAKDKTGKNVKEYKYLTVLR